MQSKKEIGVCEVKSRAFGSIKAKQDRRLDFERAKSVKSLTFTVTR